MARAMMDNNRCRSFLFFSCSFQSSCHVEILQDKTNLINSLVFFGGGRDFQFSPLCVVNPFCFCSLSKLHSRLEGLRTDHRSHRTYKVTISPLCKNNKKAKELLPSVNSALHQERKLLDLHLFLLFLLCYLSS